MIAHRGVAQLAERAVHTREVEGSSPSPATTSKTHRTYIARRRSKLCVACGSKDLYSLVRCQPCLLKLRLYMRKYSACEPWSGKRGRAPTEVTNYAQEPIA